MLGFIYGRIIMFFGRVLSIRGVIYLSGVMPGRGGVLIWGIMLGVV